MRFFRFRNSNLKGELKKSLDFLTHHYQAIYDINKDSIIGYEALLRSKSDKFEPLHIFEKARELDFIYELDKLSLIKAVDEYTKIEDILFLNVFPNTLLIKDFISWWDDNIPNNINIVLEISEKEKIENWDKLKPIIKSLRERNVKIAIDNMGVACSNLNRMIELRPEYIKFDRYFCMNLINDTLKQKILENFKNNWGHKTKFILKGIEDKETLDLTEKLGILYCQGIYLSKPMPIEEIHQRFKKRTQVFICRYKSSDKDKSNDVLFQKIKFEINKKKNQYFNIEFEDPLCSIMSICEINGVKITNKKTNICIYSLRADELSFKSKFNFPLSDNYVLDFNIALLGKSFFQKGKIIDKFINKEKTYTYEMKFLCDENKIEDNINLLNDFLLKLKKNELIEGTKFCQHKNCEIYSKH